MIKDGVKIEQKTVRSFLLIGQSNMAGRGIIGEVPPVKNANCYMLRMGRWQTMREPINTDRAIFEGKYRSGVCLATSFADALERESGEAVGLIPCADGGTRIDQWMPGEVLYDHALLMARLAMRTSHLSGILWHQGESDCKSDASALAHKEKFFHMITSLRRELGAEQLPLLIGELCEDLPAVWGLGERPKQVNRQYHELARELPLCGVVSAKGLALSGDDLHFSAASLREFGLRYLDVYKSLIHQ